jgi:hypothetical protein
MPGKGTDNQSPIPLMNIGKTGQAIDIHQVRWLRQAHIQERDQALTTGKYLGVIPIGV